MAETARGNNMLTKSTGIRYMQEYLTALRGGAVTDARKQPR